MAEPKAPRMIEMVAVHLVHMAGGKHVQPGETFQATVPDADWLMENGAAVRAAKAPTPIEAE